MADLFSNEWMQGFMEVWNSDPELAGALEKIDFNAVIGYGFPDDANPRGIINVQKGHVANAGDYNGETLNWDLRASESDWQKWIIKPPGMMGLGMAYTSRKLKFKVGDYGAMAKNPKMAGPFVKSFAAMSKV